MSKLIDSPNECGHRFEDGNTHCCDHRDYLYGHCKDSDEFCSSCPLKNGGEQLPDPEFKTFNDIEEHE